MTLGAKPSISIVGAGRVGQALGRALFLAGYGVAEVVCRSTRAARAATAFVGSGTPVALRSLGGLSGAVVLITTPDDAIESTAQRLAALDGPVDGAVVLHTSGSREASALDALGRLGAAIGSIHPLQSFATPELGVERIRGSVFAIEGVRRAASTATRLARDIGGRPVRLRPGKKALYHAAAVLASGHVTALLDMSLEALRDAGFEPDEALAAILPLTKGTIANIERAGTQKALTGPFARGDEGTIARNRKALAELDQRLADVYDALGARSRALLVPQTLDGIETRSLSSRPDAEDDADAGRRPQRRKNRPRRN